MKQYLTFKTQSIDFGLESIHVREIFPLPALQTIAEAPGDVIGLLNYRNRLIPVIHLAKRLGLSQPQCQLSDSLVVLDWQGLQVGLVVEEMRDVIDIDNLAVVESPDLERDAYRNTALVHGYGQLEDQLITLLHPESLIRQAEDVAMFAWEAQIQLNDVSALDTTETAVEDDLPTDFYHYCVDLTEAKRRIFAKRAQEIQVPLESEDISMLTPITVISLEGAYFGVDLDSVREFIQVPALTRIPCAPAHIVGSFNLRGEIMTLLDLSASLEVEVAQSGRRPKAVILEVERQRVAVAVDEVHDVLYLSTEDYLEFPATVTQEHLSFLAGAFEYQGTVIRLINLPALLHRYSPSTAIAA